MALRWHWGLTPVVVIGASLIVNIVLISVSRDVRPQVVERDAYGRSRDIDDEVQAERRWREAGLELQYQVQGQEVTLDLSGASAARVSARSVGLYRSDNAALDRVLPWIQGDPAVIRLAQTGRWLLTVTGQLDGDPEQAVRSSVVLMVPAHGL